MNKTGQISAHCNRIKKIKQQEIKEENEENKVVTNRELCGSGMKGTRYEMHFSKIEEEDKPKGVFAMPCAPLKQKTEYTDEQWRIDEYARAIESMKPISVVLYENVKCIKVDSPDGPYCDAKDKIEIEEGEGEGLREEKVKIYKNTLMGEKCPDEDEYTKFLRTRKVTKLMKLIKITGLWSPISRQIAFGFIIVLGGLTVASISTFNRCLSLPLDDGFTKDLTLHYYYSTLGTWLIGIGSIMFRLYYGRTRLIIVVHILFIASGTLFLYNSFSYVENLKLPDRVNNFLSIHGLIGNIGFFFILFMVCFASVFNITMIRKFEKDQQFHVHTACGFFCFVLLSVALLTGHEENNWFIKTKLLNDSRCVRNFFVLPLIYVYLYITAILLVLTLSV